ncbi:MAG TPA: molybdopterin oxidoreductase [Gammaproteobacteria bacterium]|nr:molybdopterin oxidoreductase [Gammaproteobacteria bacterium]|tara:strand:+ start:4162 stop:5349 length:1188 start_codon:yes stop_codon:yes gene_type:complete
MSSGAFQILRPGKVFWLTAGVAAALALSGLAGAHHMESAGHWVTGMNNRVVWGLPHVFAVFLIVAASGALNVASIASVFKKASYKPLSRLSGLMAMALLVGGLSVLVLDLGRPDRLIIAMTYYNFKSIFAWNIFLYTGLLVVVAAYLWMMFEPRMHRFVGAVGKVAFIWRLVLTTGTGSIFGVLVAREAFGSIVFVPMFISMSLSFGTAVMLLAIILMFRLNNLPVKDEVITKLRSLLAYFVITVAFFVAVDHLTRLYTVGDTGVERFLLVDGGIYPLLFWAGQCLLGTVIPGIMLLTPRLAGRFPTVVASLLVLLGAFAQLYVLIVGGQAFPMDIFPGYTETSSYFDGVVAGYQPSLPELALGLGGIGLALLIALLATRVLPFLPQAPVDQPGG